MPWTTADWRQTVANSARFDRRPSEPVWSLRKDHETMTCELRPDRQDNAGEMQIFRNGESSSGRGPGYAYARAGKRSDARRVLEELMAESRGRYVSPYNIALIFDGLGENDRAFEWLNRAYQARASRLGWLAVLPEFDHLRPDPRFSDLLRRIGLPG